ncbi:glycine--tRNA ligase [Candidatus Woesearchaeota archaeon]|nr:glycine--tRNA ligase [Candidatus Woesearchaeota archaeon]
MAAKGDLMAWIARKGFVWGPSPELYGGLAGFYDYAPLGKLLKNRVEAVIQETFVKHEFWEVECPIITPEQVWQASGHLSGFTDPLIKDEQGNVYRADHLVKERLGKEAVELDGKTVSLEAATPEQLIAVIQAEGITSPRGKKLIPEIKQHSLMLGTTVGLGQEAYNRPETATTTYLPFTRYLSFFRDKLPFGVFQVGKAFRNEVSPRQHILRQREFTQAEAQLFLFEDQKQPYEPFRDVKDDRAAFLPAGGEQQDMTFGEAHKRGHFTSEAYGWVIRLAYTLFKNMGIPADKMRLRQHAEDEKAFYADDAWDVEVELQSFGWYEICGVHDRTTYDLGQHAKHAKQRLVARNEATGKKEVPHVLEIAFGTDRPVFSLMDIFYKYDEQKEQDTFVIPAMMAPIQAAVFPLVNKEDLPDIARQIYEDVADAGLVATYDRSGSVGRRYARMDEVGTPYCITVDFDTKKDGTVTVRERDSTKQVRVKKEDVVAFIKDAMSGKQKI